MLRGASAEARTELASKLGSTRTLEDSATLGDQLLAVAGVLRAEPALRRLATDASVEGRPRPTWWATSSAASSPTPRSRW